MFVSTPNVLTLAPKGAERSGNPWHVHEYRAEEFERLCRAHFADGRDVRPVPRAQAARARARAAARLGRACTRACGLTERFYDWFTPAIAARDFALRAARRGATSTRALDFVAVCRP